MPFFRISYAFNMQADRVGGWTSSFYAEVADRNDAEQIARALRVDLLPLHGKQAVNPRARVSDMDNPRKGKPVRFANPGGLNSGGIADSAYPSNALVLELTGENGSTTRQWIKGFPVTQVGAGGVYLPTDEYKKLFDNFRNRLIFKAGPWRMCIQNELLEPQLIDGITDGSILNVPANGIPDKARVRLSRIKTPEGLNGEWTVRKQGADLLQLFGVTPQTGVAYTGPGKVLLIDRVPEKIVDAQLVMATEKDTGRPTNSLGGSRKKRRK